MINTNLTISAKSQTKKADGDGDKGIEQSSSALQGRLSKLAAASPSLFNLLTSAVSNSTTTIHHSAGPERFKPKLSQSATAEVVKNQLNTNSSSIELGRPVAGSPTQSASALKSSSSTIVAKPTTAASAVQTRLTSQEARSLNRALGAPYFSSNGSISVQNALTLQKMLNSITTNSTSQQAVVGSKRPGAVDFQA